MTARSRLRRPWLWPGSTGRQTKSARSTLTRFVCELNAIGPQLDFAPASCVRSFGNYQPVADFSITPTRRLASDAYGSDTTTRCYGSSPANGLPWRLTSAATIKRLPPSRSIRRTYLIFSRAMSRVRPSSGHSHFASSKRSFIMGRHRSTPSNRARPSWDGVFTRNVYQELRIRWPDKLGIVYRGANCRRNTRP